MLSVKSVNHVVGIYPLKAGMTEPASITDFTGITEPAGMTNLTGLTDFTRMTDFKQDSLCRIDF